MQALDALFGKLSLAVRQAGVVAKSFQGKVQNEGKSIAGVSFQETDRQRAQRSAKTLADEVVQDILLMPLLEYSDSVQLDAEEDTPLSKMFAAEGKDTAVVIDPIDGTLEYVEGRGDYLICVGLVEGGAMKLVLTFFPVHDTAYIVTPDERSLVCKDFSVKGLVGEPIILPQRFEKAVCINSRVPEEMVERLRKAGYEVLDDNGHAANGLLTVLSGKSCAYISETRNMRDILIGAVIGNAEGGFARDGSGHALPWPKSGRVSRGLRERGRA